MLRLQLEREVKKGILGEWKRLLGFTVFFPCQIKSGNWGVSSKPISFSLQVFSWAFYIFGSRTSKGWFGNCPYPWCFVSGKINSLSQAVITTSQIPPLLLQRQNDLCPNSLRPALSLSTHNIKASETDGFMGMVGPFKFWDNKTINKGPFFNALLEMKEIRREIC